MGADPNVNTGRWTLEEHKKFVQGFKMYGKCWKKITQLIGTRSVVQVRTHAQKYLIKMKKVHQLPSETSTSIANKSSSSKDLLFLEKEFCSSEDEGSPQKIEKGDVNTIEKETSSSDRISPSGSNITTPLTQSQASSPFSSNPSSPSIKTRRSSLASDTDTKEIPFKSTSLLKTSMSSKLGVHSYLINNPEQLHRNSLENKNLHIEFKDEYDNDNKRQQSKDAIEGKTENDDVLDNEKQISESLVENQEELSLDGSSPALFLGMI